MIEISDVKYSIHVKSTSEINWFRKFVELENWCKDNMGDRCYVAKPRPSERIFVFTNEEDAMAFRLTWQE